MTSTRGRDEGVRRRKVVRLRLEVLHLRLDVRRHPAGHQRLSLVYVSGFVGENANDWDRRQIFTCHGWCKVKEDWGDIDAKTAFT